MIQLYYPLICVFALCAVAQTDVCQITTRDVEGPFFEAGAPNVKVLAPTGELTPGNKITIEGFLTDSNCNPISGAIVHAWYAGGNPVGYTFPPDYLWYRGFVLTDKNGKYSFVGTYPGTYSGRPIPHIHYKVITASKELVTQLYFRNDVPPSYEDYVVGRDSQFPRNITATQSGRMINFDIVMD